METILFDDAVGDLCQCKDVYFHEVCAIKWFTPRIYGISKGKALQEQSQWNTQWYASCEVCKHNIDNAMVQKCIINLKKESFRRLQKSINPVPVPLPNSVNTPQPVHIERTHSEPLRTHPVVVDESTTQRTIVPSSQWNLFTCFSPRQRND